VMADGLCWCDKYTCVSADVASAHMVVPEKKRSIRVGTVVAK